MRWTAPTLLLTLVGVGCHKKDREILSPPEFLELCAPGGSWDKCSQNADFTNDAFPAGRLDELLHSREDVDIGPGHPSSAPTHSVFLYELQFHAAASEVFQLLKDELGEPAKQLPPWIPATLLAGKAYWVTPDGLWEISNGRVAWYSHPFESNGSVQGRLDQYVYPAPNAALTWKKIGQLLIGSDVEPVRMRKR